jgi:hypothetical protein
MPIPRKQFDKSIDTLSAEVLRFLKSNANKALSTQGQTCACPHLLRECQKSNYKQILETGCRTYLIQQPVSLNYALLD